MLDSVSSAAVALSQALILSPLAEEMRRFDLIRTKQSEEKGAGPDTELDRHIMHRIHRLRTWNLIAPCASFRVSTSFQH